VIVIPDALQRETLLRGSGIDCGERSRISGASFHAARHPG